MIPIQFYARIALAAPGHHIWPKGRKGLLTKKHGFDAPSARSNSMTDEQLADMHRLLAVYHRKLAKEALLDVVQQYHSDLAQRLADEAALIQRRTAIVERLYEREQQIAEDGDADK
jgi:hypothetical protein